MFIIPKGMIPAPYRSRYIVFPYLIVTFVCFVGWVTWMSATHLSPQSKGHWGQGPATCPHDLIVPHPHVWAKTKHNGYYEGNGYIVTYTFGHLCTLFEPNDYKSYWKSWDLNNLPMLPDKFKTKVVSNDALFGLWEQQSERFFCFPLETKQASRSQKYYFTVQTYVGEKFVVFAFGEGLYLIVNRVLLPRIYSCDNS